MHVFLQKSLESVVIWHSYTQTLVPLSFDDYVVHVIHLMHVRSGHNVGHSKQHHDCNCSGDNFYFQWTFINYARTYRQFSKLIETSRSH